MTGALHTATPCHLGAPVSAALSRTQMNGEPCLKFPRSGLTQLSLTKLYARYLISLLDTEEFLSYTRLESNSETPTFAPTRKEAFSPSLTKSAKECAVSSEAIRPNTETDTSQEIVRDKGETERFRQRRPIRGIPPGRWMQRSCSYPVPRLLGSTRSSSHPSPLSRRARQPGQSRDTLPSASRLGTRLPGVLKKPRSPQETTTKGNNQ